MKKHISKKHMSKKHMSKKHISKKHMSKKHMSKKHMSKKHMSKKHISKKSKKSNKHDHNKHLLDEVSQSIENKMFTKSADPFTIISSYKIKNIIDDKELYNKSLQLCTNKIVNKSHENFKNAKEMDMKPDKLINNKKALEICKCLLKKNSNITLQELETLTHNKEATPASTCLELL